MLRDLQIVKFVDEQKFAEKTLPPIHLRLQGELGLDLVRCLGTICSSPTVGDQWPIL